MLTYTIYLFIITCYHEISDGNVKTRTLCQRSIVPGLWLGPAEAQCPPAPAGHAACRRGWGVWRACWGGGAGPAPASLCSETSKYERESGKTEETPSARERWSLSETPNLQKTRDMTAQGEKPSREMRCFFTCFCGKHVLISQQILNVRHGIVEVKRGGALQLPAVVVGPKVNPGDNKTPLWQRHWRKMSLNSTNNVNAGEFNRLKHLSSGLFFWILFQSRSYYTQCN